MPIMTAATVILSLRELTESSSDIRFGAEREVELKGISRVQRLHEVIWLDQ